MAVYTSVSDAALEAFLTRYDIGPAVSLKGIAEGVENSNFLLETTRGRYILTLFEKRVSPEDLPYFLSLMTHCADAGLPVAPAIAQKDGSFLGELCGRPTAVIAFLKGLSVDDPSPVHCAAVGHALADLHQATSSFKMDRPNTLSLEGWIDLAAQTADGADRCEPGLGQLIADEIGYLQQHWPIDLPIGVTHSDLFPDNVLFTGSKITGIIDFYFSATDFLAYDLAVLVNAWCFDFNHQLDRKRAKAIIETYDTARPLTAAETLAMPILMRGAALRFMLTRLYDWLNQQADALVKVKDPLDYKIRLHQHRALKDLADYVV